MKNLAHLRELAQALACRDKLRIKITLESGRVLAGTYDPLFKTVSVGGSTFPEGEINAWMKLGWGSAVSSVVSNNEKEERDV